MVPFNAIWDTGATNTAITQAVIDACGLVATGMATVHHAQGSSLVETFLVNIGLPNNVGIPGIPVSRSVLPSEADILVGMDIISLGDFAVTNHDGLTKFSFRVPSVDHIDFVEEANRPQFAHGGSKKPKRRTPPRVAKKGKKRKRNR